MLRSMKWKALICIGVLALAGACGDDSSSGGSNNGGGNNGGANDTSSFSAEVETESGTEQHSGEQKDEQAAEGTWGATIVDSELHLTLTSAQGTVISAVVETTETAKAPGDFTPLAGIDGTHVTLLSAAAGNAFTSAGTGTISLTSCPRQVGEHATGSFNNVELAADTGDSTWTINGDFDVTVFAKSGDLFCNEQSSNNDTNNTTNNDTNNNTNNNQCSADWCEDGGVCCEYLPCISQCEMSCFQSAECQGGLNPQACAECANGCLDECNVSTECRSAMGDVNTCSEAASCDEAADDDAEQACLESNCCAEVNAAL